MGFKRPGEDCSFHWFGGWDVIKQKEHRERTRERRGKIHCFFNMLSVRFLHGIPVKMLKHQKRYFNLMSESRTKEIL